MSLVVLRDEAWRTHDLTGRRVAVLGPGAEAAPVAVAALRAGATVTVFQDEPDWLLPGPARMLPLPGLLARRAAALHLRVRVGDPWVRRLLTPHPRFGHRRPALDPAFYRAIDQGHCRLVAWPVYALVAGGVRSAEGVEHRVDVVVITRGSRHRDLRPDLEETCEHAT